MQNQPTPTSIKSAPAQTNTVDMQKMPIDGRSNPVPHGSKRGRKNPDGFFFWCLLLFALFELFLLTVLMVRLIPASNGEQTPPAQNTEPTQPQPPAPQPPSPPVFSGGVLPAAPTVRDQTKLLTSEIDSQYAILINADTGEVVAQKSADTVFSPASMTKVMTLIVACENLTEADLARRLSLTDEVVKHTTSGNYFDTEFALPRELNGLTCIGDSYRIKDLLYGIGVMSAADCTYMIACEVGGSEAGFVDLMNRKAEALGLTNTHFDNAVGFDSETNVTTAKDMAVIMAYAMQCRLIVDILTPREENYRIDAYYEDGGVEKSYPVWLKPSWNSRLTKYPTFSLSTVKLTATKTGYTDESFIVCAATGKTSGQRYILVLGNKESIHTSTAEKLKATMIDVEALFNQYVK